MLEISPPQPSLGVARLPGRDTELAAIDTLLRAAATGAGRVALVEGLGGYGRTSLLRTACARARVMGYRVLSARANQHETAFPYAVAHQLLEPLDAAGAADGSAAALDGLFRQAAALATEQPLVLAVDDADLADDASMRWLGYLVRRVDDLPVVLLLTVGPGVARPLLQAVIGEAAAAVTLHGLDDAAVAELLEAALGAVPEPGFTRECHTFTRGNPLLLSRLAAGLASHGIMPLAQNAGDIRRTAGPALSRAVAGLLTRACPDALPVAEAVVVLGPHADWRHIVELCCLDPVSARETADRLAAAGLLDVDGRLELAPAAVRAAVDEGLSAGRRAELHGRAAEILARAGVDESAVADHLIAAHAGTGAWAVDVLRSAARAALTRGCAGQAVTYLRRAIAEPPVAGERGQVLLELGRAELRTGDRAGLERLERAATGPDAELALARALGYTWDGRFRRAAAVLEQALETGEGEAAARLESELLALATLHADVRAANRPRLERLAATPDGGPRFAAAIALERALAGAPAGSVVEEGLRAFEEPGSMLGSPALAGAARALLAAGRLDDVERRCARDLARAEARDWAPGRAIAAGWRAEFATLRGDVATAEAEARRALEGAAAWEPLRPAALALLVDALVERGELEAAQQALVQVDPDAAATPMHTLLLHSRGRLRLALGRTDEALADLLACGRRQAALGARNPALLPWRSSAALALLAGGARERAATLADEELEAALAFGASRAVGVAARVAGLAHGGRRGMRLLEDAADALAESPAVLEHTRALIDLGAALRRSGQRVRAREPLRRGLDQACRAGAGGLAERARTELLAAGARPRRVLLSGLEALTPSEQRVAGMAARGMTNRQLADALFVTPKTVEVHLRNAYRKLGIDSRAELPAALDAEGPR